MLIHTSLAGIDSDSELLSSGEPHKNCPTLLSDENTENNHFGEEKMYLARVSMSYGVKFDLGLKAGSWKKEQKQRSQRSAAHWLAP